MRLLEGAGGLAEYRTPFRLYDGRTGRWAGVVTRSHTNQNPGREVVSRMCDNGRESLTAKVHVLALTAAVILLAISCSAGRIQNSSSENANKRTLCIESLIVDSKDTVLVVPVEPWERIDYDRVGARCYSVTGGLDKPYRFLLRVNGATINELESYIEDEESTLWRLSEASDGAYESYRESVLEQDTTGTVNPEPRVLVVLETGRFAYYFPIR